jgi:hypothetical protein
MNMKAIKVKTALLLIIISVLLIQACKKDDPQLATDRIKSLLIDGAWTLQTALVDEVDKTSLYEGLILNFTKTSFTSVNGGVVWPSNGSWEFKDASGETIIRDDGLEIDIVTIDKSTLQITFTLVEGSLDEARQTSVAGNHVFTFIQN